MPLLSQSIPNLINGISQQPAALRLSSQGALQENAYSSVVEGLKKRSPTYHTAKIINGTLADAFSHTINRDTLERYEVIVTEGNIRVFTLTGVEKTVNAPADETYTILSGAAAVLNGATYKIYPATGETAVDFTVSGIGTATVKLQMSNDGSAWTDVDTRTTNGTTTGVLISGRVYLRAIVSAWTAGTISATVTYKTFRYVGTATPSTKLRATTVADYTFVVNTEKVASMSALTSAAAGSEGLVYVRQGNYSTVYKVFVDNVEQASYTTHDTNIADIRTDVIAAALVTQLTANLGAGWTISREGSTVRIVKDNGTAYKLRATDSNGDRNTVVVKEQIQKFSDLPNVAPNGFIIRITGDPGANADDYYVKFETQDAGTTFGRGVWNESLKPGIQYAFDASTMPHQLVRQGDGTFTFGPATWDNREVGDTVSAPDPSFVGRTISDILFYRNRLGFLSDENTIFSRAGKFFTFWPTTVTAQLDDDPIDVAASHTRVSILTNAVSFAEQLLLFSDQTQFRLDHGDLLTPKTVSIKPITEFENVSAKPVGVGKNVYFAVPKGAFVGLREYYVDKDNNTNDAADITAHTPAYIPKGVFKIAAATNEDLLVVLTTGEQSSAFVYKYYWSGNDKLQSAWSKWTFGSGVKVLNADFVEMDLILVIQREDGVYLEKVSVEPERQDTGLTYENLIDRKITEAACTSVVYDAPTDFTTWTLPYAESGTMRVVTRPGGPRSNGVVATITRPTSTTIKAAGDWTGQPVYIGLTYAKRYRFSSPSLKERQSNGAEAPIAAARVQVRQYTVTFDGTGYFRAEVTPLYGDTYTYRFTGRVLGSGNNVIGASALEKGEFTIPIRSKADRFILDIINDSHLPSRIQSAEWEAMVVMRAARA